MDRSFQKLLEANRIDINDQLEKGILKEFKIIKKKGPKHMWADFTR